MRLLLLAVRKRDGTFATFLSRIHSPALLLLAQHWNAARGSKRMPSWADVPSPAHSPYSKMLWGYQYDSETEEFRGRLAGQKFSRWVSENFLGTRYQDLALTASPDESHRCMTKIVTACLAYRSSGCLFTVRDFAVKGERIVLPLSADGKTVDGILEASDYVPPPLLGPAEFVHENAEWYAI